MQNNQGSSSVGSLSKATAEKVKKLSHFLADGGPGRERHLSDLDLRAGQLAHQLFAKAPAEFLEKRSLGELGAITDVCMNCLERFCASPQVPAIVHTNTDRGTAFSISLGDRPFIINTVLEVLRSQELAVTILLHPILLSRGQRISLSYFETTALSEDARNMLERRLAATLSDLMTVTDDFTATLVQAETIARVLDSSRISWSHPLAERKEYADFIRWLTDGGFIFLGHRTWAGSTPGDLGTADKGLGLLRVDNQRHSELSKLCQTDAKSMAAGSDILSINKLPYRSPVHRTNQLLHLLVTEHSSEGKLVSTHSFVGMLTSKALSQESSSIPLIRRKLQRLIEIEGLQENTFDYKSIVSIIDGMPEDEALRADLDTLRTLVNLVSDAQTRHETRALLVPSGSQGVLALLVLPRDHFTSETRQRARTCLEESFGVQAGSTDVHVDFASNQWVRLYFHVATKSPDPRFNRQLIEQSLVGASKSWNDQLLDAMAPKAGAQQPSSLALDLAAAFEEDYQALQTINEALIDIRYLETLSAQNPIRVSINPAGDSQSKFVVVVYSYAQLVTISRAVPALEHAGLEVINERSFHLKPGPTSSLYISRFLVKPLLEVSLTSTVLAEIVGPGLEAILGGAADDDSLNSLMLSAQLNTRAVGLLRTYCSFLSQATKSPSRSTIKAILAAAPQCAQHLVRMFDILFKPGATPVATRRESFKREINDYRDSLRSITDITKDKVLRSLALLMEHTVRTNYFMNQAQIAIKLRSEAIEILPSPRPLYEIFVFAPDVEGVHLRGSAVARGGIRWSDRPEDYRSEVLGLMKTQKIKNAVIVPGGAKGGFIAKLLPADPKAVAPAVESAYRTFIRALLSITDNRTGSSVKHPDGIVIHDGEDPYFVVAADKGTATFSDTANRIAVEEFNFWLGDAFASGGSQGYDHKLYGITAKGGWECVLRHFHDMGVDPDAQPFTAIGIGDMAGDVFGNGLILSKAVKLLAAFNHKHIFIDPNPDPSISFEERKRLFNTKGSQWSDYRAELISAGGGIFGRFDKEITISTQARTALGIPDSAPATLNGEQLINLILQAPVDLLWNGGIGTYVKASSESHSDVNDGTNDRVRVSASELRAKIIGEGGNLGFTQRARVEFDQLGGRLNTDAIDNSGGVDLSDHEVNIKILFSAIMREKKLTVEERNKLLKAMAPEVVEHVLDHNRGHALVLTLAKDRSIKNLGYFQSLIREMHRLGYVNRHLECLPDEEELRDRIAHRLPMTRPELAVCIAAVKLWVKDGILKSTLPQDPALQDYLMGYFPRAIREKFTNDVLHHPLAANIIAAQVANSLVNMVGITFIHRMVLNYSTTVESVIKCILAADQLLGARQMYAELRRFDTPKHAKVYLEAQSALSRALGSTASWLLSSSDSHMPLVRLVQSYQSSLAEVLSHPEACLASRDLERMNKEAAGKQAAGIDANCARSLALYPHLRTIFELLWVARQTNKDPKRVGTVFSAVLEEFALHTLVELAVGMEARDKWENQLLISSSDDLRRSLSTITTKLVELGAQSREDVAAKLRKASSFERVRSITEDAKTESPTVATLSVLARQLRTFNLE
ncbi:MAG: NAD-glutamate dehydrogenase [Oligoflexia bacterium]|nr:NAD-glutamate dehydrogenase [Oligoflexia bacterium]